MGLARMWFGSGAVFAGVGAAMLSGAGPAAADTADDSGSSGPARASAASSEAPPAVERGARLNRSADSRRSAAVVAPVAATVRAAAAEVRAAAATMSTSPAVVTVPSAPNRANRADRVRPRPPASAPVAPIPVVPASDPVDPAQFAGTYYEQGSVKQFFAIGLVNTKAVYSLNPNGTIRVENSGNYIFNRGLLSSIVGSAVPVNDTNTALNVGFGATPSAAPPGNYTILAYAPDYNWVIVSDPSGQSGYILTRDKNISPQQYRQLLAQARALGVRGNVTPTVQYA